MVIQNRNRTSKKLFRTACPVLSFPLGHFSNGANIIIYSSLSENITFVLAHIWLVMTKIVKCLAAGHVLFR